MLSEEPHTSSALRKYHNLVAELKLSCGGYSTRPSGAGASLRCAVGFRVGGGRLTGKIRKGFLGKKMHFFQAVNGSMIPKDTPSFGNKKAICEHSQSAKLPAFAENSEYSISQRIACLRKTLGRRGGKQAFQQVLEQLCPLGLPEMMEMFCNQHRLQSSHWPHVAIPGLKSDGLD